MRIICFISFILTVIAANCSNNLKIVGTYHGCVGQNIIYSDFLKSDGEIEIQTIHILNNSDTISFDGYNPVVVDSVMFYNLESSIKQHNFSAEKQQDDITCYHSTYNIDNFKYIKQHDQFIITENDYKNNVMLLKLFRHGALLCEKKINLIPEELEGLQSSLFLNGNNAVVLTRHNLYLFNLDNYQLKIIDNDCIDACIDNEGYIYYTKYVDGFENKKLYSIKIGEFNTMKEIINANSIQLSYYTASNGICSIATIDNSFYNLNNGISTKVKDKNIFLNSNHDLKVNLDSQNCFFQILK